MKHTGHTKNPNRRKRYRDKVKANKKRFPDIAHRDSDIRRITTTYSNMPRGGTKKDSVSYKQGFDAGKLRISDGFNTPGGYLGDEAVKSFARQRSDKYYGLGYKAGESVRAKYFQKKARTKKTTNRGKRNK